MYPLSRKHKKLINKNTDLSEFATAGNGFITHELSSYEYPG